MPTLRRDHAEENLTAKGAYLIRKPVIERDVTLLASGSEVAIALEAADLLKTDGLQAAVVSMPCWELFRQQPPAYQKSVLGCLPRVAVEAALRQGWDQWIGPKGGFVGMTGYGASAPGPELYSHFGITVEAVVAAVRKAIG